MSQASDISSYYDQENKQHTDGYIKQLCPPRVDQGQQNRSCGNKNY